MSQNDGIKSVTDAEHIVNHFKYTTRAGGVLELTNQKPAMVAELLFMALDAEEKFEIVKKVTS